jgi:sugar lactone lactonase YvrE
LAEPREILARLVPPLVAALAAVLIATPAAGARPNDINTFAGSGTAGFSGDGGPARQAKLDAPGGLAFRSGSLYISDHGNHNNRVRKVNSSRRISTVAGRSGAGFSGDGGQATSAKLNYPIGLAVDGSGRLYIADSANHRVRRVGTSGKIGTIAGTGTAGFLGEGSPAVLAHLNFPWGLAVSGGGYYLADSNNNRVRKVSSSGSITTVAGNGTFGFGGDDGPATAAKLEQPGAVAVGRSGNLFIADFGNNRVREVDSSGTITTVAGTGAQGFSGDGGNATNAKLNAPSGLAVDHSGNLYIADSGNNRVRKVNGAGKIITVAGTGKGGFSGDGSKATKAKLNYPIGLAFDRSHNLFIADSGNHRVRRVAAVR